MHTPIVRVRLKAQVQTQFRCRLHSHRLGWYVQITALVGDLVADNSHHAVTGMATFCSSMTRPTPHADYTCGGVLDTAKDPVLDKQRTCSASATTLH